MHMVIGIPTETTPGETRVALMPGMVAQLTKEGHEVLIQSGAGTASRAPDEAYVKAGARVVADAAAVYAGATVIFRVHPPALSGAESIREGSVYIGYLAPLANGQLLDVFLRRKKIGRASCRERV